MAEHESIGANLASNPGSWNDFLERTGMQPGPEAFRALSEELAVFRSELADIRGISLEELHSRPLTFSNSETTTRIGKTALAD